MKLKMVTTTTTDKKQVTWIHQGIAWVAAQAIAQKTHCAVTLIGTHGTATFNGDGSGSVFWNEKSASPGKTTLFGSTTTVCI